MFHKYIKTILLATVVMYASPEIYHSLGDELDKFQNTCEAFQEMSLLPKKIKSKCRVFDTKIDKAFKTGYALDAKKDSSISEKKLNNYLTTLRSIMKDKEKILDMVHSEKVKARKQNNIKYYSQIIKSDKIKLYSSDYEYMKKNKDIFSKNERYNKHLKQNNSINITKTHMPAKNVKIDTLNNQNKNLQTNQFFRDLNMKLGSHAGGNLRTRVYVMTVNVEYLSYDYSSWSATEWWSSIRHPMKSPPIYADCKVYGNIGSALWPRQSSLIGEVENAKLTKSSDAIHIKIEAEYFKRAIVKCTFKSGGKERKFTDTFADIPHY